MSEIVKVVKGRYIEEWVSYNEEDEEEISKALNEANGKFFVDDFIYYSIKKYMSSKKLYQATYLLGKKVGVIEYLKRVCSDSFGFMKCELSSLLDDMHRFEYTISYDPVELIEDIPDFLLEYLEVEEYSDKEEVDREYLEEAINNIFCCIKAIEIKENGLEVKLHEEPIDFKLFDTIVNLLYGDIKDIFYNTYVKSMINLFFRVNKEEGHIIEEWTEDVWYLEPNIKDKVDSLYEL